MKKKSCIVVLVMAFLSGCTATSVNNNNGVQSENPEKVSGDVFSLLSGDDRECIAGIGCTFIESYTNGLGQECKSFTDTSDMQRIFCKSASDGWSRINIL
jgi:hypothetical protein